jgi:DeoR/GlpR family transcriptional regulator of sugar metabolism
VEQAIRSYIGENLPLAGALSWSAGDGPNLSAALATSMYETSLLSRFSVNAQEKRAIAQKAATLIDPGQTLFVDGGTTCIALAKVLAHQQKGLSVVTNSTLICLELGHSRAHRVHAVGGEYDAYSASFVGRTSEHEVVNFFVDLCVFSTKAFLAGEGTFEASPGTVRVKQAVARNASKIILLVDHTKFGQRALRKVLDIDQIDTVVTDSKAPEADIDLLRSIGREVIVCESTETPR